MGEPLAALLVIILLLGFIIYQIMEVIKLIITLTYENQSKKWDDGRGSTRAVPNTDLSGQEN